jgi:hypothetical protein
MVTAELVRPIPNDQKPPELAMPKEFLKEPMKEAPRQPGMAVTGPVPVRPVTNTIPVEKLEQFEKSAPATQAPSAPQIQFVPMITPPQPAPTQPYSLPATQGTVK